MYSKQYVVFLLSVFTVYSLIYELCIIHVYCVQCVVRLYIRTCNLVVSLCLRSVASKV